MITQIRISGFKSLADVTVDLSPVTVLIGKSGTGKSNFMDALRFLRNCLLRRDFHQAIQAEGGATNIQTATNRSPKSVSFRVAFFLDDEEDKYEYLLTFDLSNPANPTREEYLRTHVDFLFHAQSNRWLVPPNVVNPPQPGINQIILGAIPGLQESSIAYSVLAYGIGCHRFSDEVLRPIGAVSMNGLSDGAENYLAVFGEIV